MMKIINDTYKGSVRYVVGQTEGVCSQAIELLVEGNLILDAAFQDGRIVAKGLCHRLYVLS